MICQQAKAQTPEHAEALQRVADYCELPVSDNLLKLWNNSTLQPRFISHAKTIANNFKTHQGPDQAAFSTSVRFRDLSGKAVCQTLYLQDPERCATWRVIVMSNSTRRNANLYHR